MYRKTGAEIGKRQVWTMRDVPVNFSIRLELLIDSDLVSCGTGLMGTLDWLIFMCFFFFLLAAEWPSSAGEVSASLLGPQAICLGSYFSRGDVWPFLLN